MAAAVGARSSIGRTVGAGAQRVGKAGAGLDRGFDNNGGVGASIGLDDDLLAGESKPGDLEVGQMVADSDGSGAAPTGGRNTGDTNSSPRLVDGSDIVTAAAFLLLVETGMVEGEMDGLPPK